MAFLMPFFCKLLLLWGLAFTDCVWDEDMAGLEDIVVVVNADEEEEEDAGGIFVVLSNATMIITDWKK